MNHAYPEINIQISTTTKLPVAHLEGNSHLVVLVQDFVEAFPRMRLELDVVRIAEGEQGQNCQEESDEKRHLPGRAMRRELYRISRVWSKEERSGRVPCRSSV